jgi:hypothetical protein
MIPQSPAAATPGNYRTPRPRVHSVPLQDCDLDVIAYRCESHRPGCRCPACCLMGAFTRTESRLETRLFQAIARDAS